MSANERPTPQDPLFITRLFSLKKYNCHFIVGNQELNEPECIGVVIEMLVAHSDVLQSEMLVKDVEENKSVAINDLEPDTFKNLLRYVYGYDNTEILCFDEADNLLYAAEKYMIEPLKGKLSKRLIKLLSYENICSLLNNPVCSKSLELDSAITKILQHETDKVLSNPLFLDLCPDGVTKVFEQEAMNVSEIEVWRAAVKWAKHRTNSDNGQDLRRALEGPAQHIRVCAVDDDSFYNEVYPTGILTENEVVMVSFSKHNNRKHNELVVFSNEIEDRSSNLLKCKLICENHTEHWDHSSIEVYLSTYEYDVGLTHFEFIAGENTTDPSCLLSECKGTIIISRITDNKRNGSSLNPLILNLCYKVENKKHFKVLLTKEGRKIVLSANSRYRITVLFQNCITMLFSDDENPYKSEYLCLKPCKDENVYVVQFYAIFYNPYLRELSTE